MELVKYLLMRIVAQGEGPATSGVPQLDKLQRAGTVFIARLLVAYGNRAPEILHDLADELSWAASIGNDELDDEPDDIEPPSDKKKQFDS
jgi:hypothetical protein